MFVQDQTNVFWKGIFPQISCPWKGRWPSTCTSWGFGKCTVPVATYRTAEIARIWRADGMALARMSLATYLWNSSSVLTSAFDAVQCVGDFEFTYSRSNWFSIFYVFWERGVDCVALPTTSGTSLHFSRWVCQLISDSKSCEYMDGRKGVSLVGEEGRGLNLLGEKGEKG